MTVQFIINIIKQLSTISQPPPFPLGGRPIGFCLGGVDRLKKDRFKLTLAKYL